jgi:predicted AAA+ superfamily ATPase
MYKRRTLEKEIEEALHFFPIVLLTGARQVGKSTLCLEFPNFEYITLDDTTLFSFAKSDPIGFIASLKKPIIIDEIQKVPQLLSEIKKDIDSNRINGSYLLTGSANLLSFKNISDTLAGRVAIFELYPFSMKEYYNKDENVVEMLLGDIASLNLASLDVDSIKNHIIHGGYPEIQKISSQKMRYIWFSSYIRTYIERDIRDIGELRNLDKFIGVYNLLATRSANILNKRNISKDTQVDAKTLDNYLTLLEQVYQVFTLKSYQKNIGKEMIKSPKIYFADSGVLSHLLRVRTIDELNHSPYNGDIVETFVYSELKKHISLNQEFFKINYYRTKDKNEIDFIVENDTHILAIEVKSSQTARVDDFRHIISFDSMVTDKKVVGIVLYFGQNVVRFKEKFWAVPMRVFF